jgi:hypothetical protein
VATKGMYVSLSQLLGEGCGSGWAAGVATDV